MKNTESNIKPKVELRAKPKAEEKKERILRLLLDGTLPVQKIASIYDLQIEDVEKIQREYLNKR